MGYRNAIGEYVHLRAENYKKYGIGRTAPDKMSLAQSYNAAKTGLIPYIKMSQTGLDLQKLEEFYNAEKLRIGNNANLILKTDVLDKFFIDEVNRHFDAKAQKIDFNNLTVSSFGGLLQQEKMNYQKKRQSQDPYFQLKTFENFKAKLINSKQLLAQALQKGIVDKAQAQKHLLELNDIKNKALILENQIKTDGLLSLPFGQGSNLFDRYNQIVSAYSLPSKKDLGDLGEFFAMYVALRASQESSKEIKKLFKDFLNSPISANRTQTAYDLAGFIKEEDLGKGFQNFSMRFNQGGRNLFVTTTGSQNTIDIKTDFTDGNVLYGSVKNVSSINKEIHVLSGAPVTALFNLINTDYINHYMNLLSFNLTSGRYGNEINEIFYKGTAIRALSGARQSIYTGLQPLANALIINQTKGDGKVKIFSVSQLLFKMMWGENATGIKRYLKINLSDGNDNFGKIKVKNRPVGDFKLNPNFNDAGKRIAKIFADIHAVKIEASLLPGALK